MKKQVIRISIVQTAKISAAFHFLLGFIYTLFGIGMILVGNDQFQTMGWIFIFAPIYMGVAGFISFVIWGAIYNALASWVGGIEVEVKDIPTSP